MYLQGPSPLFSPFGVLIKRTAFLSKNDSIISNYMEDFNDSLGA
jgi:hypothetical protein